MTEAARGHLAMLTFSALVAGSFSLGGLAVPFIDPAVLNALRFTLGAALLWALAAATGGIDRTVLAAPWRYLLLGGLFALYFVTMFEGLKTADAVSMAAVFTLNPAMAAVFGWLLLRQITTARMASGLALGAAGAIWVIFDGSWSAARTFEIGEGESIYLWGVLAHSLYAPLLRMLSRGEPALAFNAAVMTAGALILVLWAPGRILATDWASLPWIVWITILYVAWVATALTFMCIRYATVRLPSAKVMAYTYLTPSWVILWELALGQGIPAALILPGVAMTALALALMLKNEEPAQPAQG